MTGEPPQAYWHTTPKARKAHTCCECGGRIEPGEHYHRHRGVWEWTPETYRVCVDCEALRADIDRGRHLDETTPFGFLSEEVADLERDEPDLAARFAAIRAKRGLRYRVVQMTPAGEADRTEG